MFTSRQSSSLGRALGYRSRKITDTRFLDNQAVVNYSYALYWYGNFNRLQYVSLVVTLSYAGQYILITLSFRPSYERTHSESSVTSNLILRYRCCRQTSCSMVER